MDIRLPDSWLRDYLKTSATPEKIAEYVSLCGPSVERVEKIDKECVYSIEITTNRVDSAGAYGLAREMAAILPRFDVKASLASIKTKSAQPIVKKVSWLAATVDYNLCQRFTAILIRDVKIKPSPEFIQTRLKLVGLRPINNVVDISNYLMHELGQPVHTFDYDKILDAKMVLRASKKGETVTTLDGKNHKLPGGDIIIEDGQKRLIDLAGIMGGANSAVDGNTKNVLLFVQTYNPYTIRQTSMKLAHRSEASSLFEKGLDPELVEPTIRRGIDLFTAVCKGKPESTILDLYPNPYKPHNITLTEEFIAQRLGIKISKQDIARFLTPLGFNIAWKKDVLTLTIPSWRSRDVNIPEDIVEEVARIYGYHNLPSDLMTGKIPEPLENAPFVFEMKIKQLLKGWGGIEVYTLSLVSKNMILASQGQILRAQALKLKNPLGADSEYLRTSLMSSLVWAAQQNKHTEEPFHLFEMANIYLPRKENLPQERIVLAGIFNNHDYENAKGIIQTFLGELNIHATLKPKNYDGFINNHSLSINCNGRETGKFGIIQDVFIYYEFIVELLAAVSQPHTTYVPLPKYPAQVEDITLIIPPKVLIGSVTEIIQEEQRVVSVELIGMYENTRTFRIFYQHPNKTLTDQDVKEIRSKIIKKLEKQLGVQVK